MHLEIPKKFILGHPIQHPQNLQQCRPSSRLFLMPLNSKDFNQILNIASVEHMWTIQNVIKDTCLSQEHPHSSSTPATTPVMSSIFEIFFYFFKLNRFQPNFEHSFLRAYTYHPKHYQGHEPQSGMSIILINSSYITSFILFLMPSYSTDFNQILNITSAEHIEVFQNIFKVTSTSLDYRYS